MGFFDGFLDKMKLNDSDNYDDEDRDLYDEDEEEVSNVRKPRSKSEDIFEEKQPEETRPVKSTARPTKPVRPVSRPATSGSSKVVSMQKNSRALELCVIKPTNVEDGREISDTLLSGRPVVLNLEGIDVDIAQRIIDFTSGACYSIQGNLQKVTNYIFIITPESVDISGDFQELMGSDFTFNKGSIF